MQTRSISMLEHSIFESLIIQVTLIATLNFAAFDNNSYVMQIWGQTECIMEDLKIVNKYHLVILSS